MQATYIQKIIRLNAKQIAIKEGLITACKNDGQFFAKLGEKAFSIAAYKDADKLARAKAKLVDIQRALKTELATIHRTARIQRKIATLSRIIPGFAVEGAADMTSRELEEALDIFAAAVLKPKADTRVPAAA